MGYKPANFLALCKFLLKPTLRETSPMCHKLACAALNFALLFSLATLSFAQQSNWPQWRGPARDGKSTDTGLLKSWPAGGPKRVWMFENCGTGFGAPAVVDGRIYIMGARGAE